MCQWKFPAKTGGRMDLAHGQCWLTLVLYSVVCFLNPTVDGNGVATKVTSAQLGKVDMHTFRWKNLTWQVVGQARASGNLDLSAICSLSLMRPSDHDPLAAPACPSPASWTHPFEGIMGLSEPQPTESQCSFWVITALFLHWWSKWVKYYCPFPRDLSIMVERKESCILVIAVLCDFTPRPCELQRHGSRSDAALNDLCLCPASNSLWTFYLINIFHIPCCMPVCLKSVWKSHLLYTSLLHKTLKNLLA